MEVFSRILLILLLTRTLTGRCPFYKDRLWELRNFLMDCRNDTTYHCRMHQKQPIHFCHSILICPPGFFASLDRAEPSPTLKCVPCPDDRFDPEESRSDIKNECQFIRQKCDISDHKILWKQGNSTTDDMCYCDYRAGYEMDTDSRDTIPQTSIKICDGITRCDCRHTLSCNASPGKHLCLLPDKTCTEQCPPGYTRPNLSFECVDQQSLNINSSTNPHDMPTMLISMPAPKTALIDPVTISPGNVQSTSKSARETTGNTTDSSISSAVIIVLVVLGCLIMAVIVISVFFRRKCYSSSQTGKDNGDAAHPLENVQCESQPMLNPDNDTANNNVDLNLDMRS
ncbi:hypothetical protein ACJMK2_026644 [Sinanodonta woodiana]|uniref:Uncharacterized protein n=1 Tax=Sinanodonta woodiana TaxID=1069815 RepID=A0ABD3XKF8_SINWO